MEFPCKTAGCNERVKFVYEPKTPGILEFKQRSSATLRGKDKKKVRAYLTCPNGHQNLYQVEIP